MKADTQPNSKQFWQGHVNQWNKSSLSQALYCRDHALSIKRFGYWKRKLLGASKQTTNSKKSDGFIQITPRHYQPTQVSPLVVELPNQLRIEGVTTDNLSLVKELAGLL